MSRFKTDSQPGHGYGNQQFYVSCRLARDHPALWKKVINGELSIHAAAVQAGFKRRVMQIDIDDPLRAAWQIIRARPEEFRAKLAQWLLLSKEEFYNEVAQDLSAQLAREKEKTNHATA
jgi:hypothetical protein